jgi:hypothetical protein
MTKKKRLELGKGFIKSFLVSLLFYLFSTIVIVLLSILGLISAFLDILLRKTNYISSNGNHLYFGIFLFIPLLFSLYWHFKSPNNNRSQTKGFLLGSTLSLILMIILVKGLKPDKEPVQNRYEQMMDLPENVENMDLEKEPPIAHPVSSDLENTTKNNFSEPAENDPSFRIKLISQATVSKVSAEERIGIYYFISATKLAENEEVWINPIPESLPLLTSFVYHLEFYDSIIEVPHFQYFFASCTQSHLSIL